MIGLLKQFAPHFLYLSAIIVGLVSLTGRVRYGLFFLVPLVPLQNVLERLDFLPLGKDLNDILLICMIVGWLVSRLSSKDPFLAKTPFNWILFTYAIFTYITLWVGSFTINAPFPLDITDPRVQFWKNYMVMPLFFFLTLNHIKTTKDLKKLFLLMCAAILLMEYYSFQQVGLMTSWVSRTKVHGTFVHLGANEVAAFYATYTFVLIGVFLWEKRTWIKLSLLSLIAVASYIVVFMYSRGAYMATAIGLLFLGLVRVRIVLVGMILFAICWNTIVPASVMERLQFTEHEGQLDESAATRLVMWEQSLLYFQHNPIMGVGFNVFSYLELKTDTHNVFLRTLAEQGLIGITFLLTIMILSLVRGWQLYRRTEDPLLKGLGLGFTACTISLMVANFFGDRWGPLPLGAFFWVFLAMVERGHLIVSSGLAATNESQRPRKKTFPHAPRT
ncbi:MAG: O-antigen ligase family protein [Candidatus Omnitrophica bacterium]|nr:O-antigen ligase family protein [Candidatus Omnitrophota bacterium]